MLIIGLISKDGLRKRETYTFRSGIAAGVFATSSYAIVVWSMQFIEIAYVSSIREISIVFATSAIAFPILSLSATVITTSSAVV